MRVNLIAGSLRHMHALKVITSVALVIAGAGFAQAGDVRHRPTQYVVITHDVPFGERPDPVVVYDYEPGVVTRAYWLPPWQHRHYFPFGADRVAVHRPAHRAVRPRRAESFERYWSTDSFLGDLPPLPPHNGRFREEAPIPLPPK
jgi:hypothetical protein